MIGSLSKVGKAQVALVIIAVATFTVYHLLSRILPPTPPMQSQPTKKHRRLAGCIPIKLSDTGIVNVMLITSRRHEGKLVFPKGGVKKGEDPEKAALRETWEEAGIRGVVVGRLKRNEPTTADLSEEDSLYHNDQHFQDDEHGESDRETASPRHPKGEPRNSAAAWKHAKWYVLEVTEEHQEWPEKGQRERLWFTLEEALGREGLSQQVRDLLERLDEFLQSFMQSKQEQK